MPHGSEREGRLRPLKICPATYGTQGSAASVPATWWVEEDSETGADTVLDAQAFKDRRRLGQAVSMLISSDLADYAPDKRHYDRLADELNERYGAVVHSDELGHGGPGPGFRTNRDPGS